MSVKKEVVIFGFDEVKRNKLSSICLKYDASLKNVEKNILGNKLEDIIKDRAIESAIDEKNFKSFENEKVILFNNFNEDELNKVIKDIRADKDLKCILAVITPTSIEWEFKYLLEHLIEEREWFRKNNNK
ncbi:DUF3783 domain-containing protein [Hathewaya histolytica]|uniref:DUF3783 domain-containing protein n=1 Tax=Hathewaya histolytica TaxID=1498 RepID=UPI003B670946